MNRLINTYLLVLCMFVGLAIGYVLQNIPLWIVLGILFGILVGMKFPQSSKEDRDL